MKAIYIVSGFFLVPGITGMLFAFVAVIGKFADSTATVGDAIGYSIGVSFLPLVFLSLGLVILWGGYSARKQSRPPCR